MKRALMAVVLVAAVVGVDVSAGWAQGSAASSPATAPKASANAPDGGAVVLEAVDGKANGTSAAFAAWKEKLLAKRDGKLGSHDWWWWGIGTFDYDNDGALDLVATVHGPSNGLIFKSQWTDGKLALRDVTEELGAAWVVPGANFNPVFWDFDGDGWLDIWAVGHDAAIPCLFNEGGKKFVQTPFKSAIYANPQVEDLNGDGFADVWHLFREQRQEMIFDPKGRTFTQRSVPYAIPTDLPETVAQAVQAAAETKNAWPRFYRDVDLNADGVADVVFSSFGGYGNGPCQGRYMIADGKGGLADKTEEIGLPTTGTPILLEDLTGDGAPEVLVAADDKGGLYVNDGKGRFTLQAGPLTDRLKKRLPYCHRALAVDLDNTGRLGVVISTRRGESQHIFANLGGGQFRQTAQSDAWIDGVGIADLDDDGRMDVFVGRKEPSITVFLNRTPQVGNWVKIVPRMDKPNWAAIGAVIEVFQAGDLGGAAARPLFKGKANSNAMPVHVGLAGAKACDVRVLFPGHDKPVEFKNLASNAKWQLTPDGKSAQAK